MDGCGADQGQEGLLRGALVGGRRIGMNEVNQALPAGSYQLHIHLENGTERIVPVQIDAGRVSDVEIDVDAL